MAIIVSDADEKKSAYLLTHLNDKQITKVIGVFTAIENAENAIESLKDEAYFNEFPLDCFKIEKVELDKNNYKETPLVFKV